VLGHSRSLFERATRYSGSENRLTGILAAVLERVPEAGEELARAWTEPHPEAAAAREVASPATASAHHALDGLKLRSVKTQLRTRQGWQVDLALRFGHHPHPSPEDVVIWVEDKLGADPHEDQLANYAEDVPKNVRGSAVVLLAPRSSLPYADQAVPDGVPQRSWQEAGRLLSVLSEDLEGDAVSAFLLKELIAYMREENLTDPEAIRPEHLVALSYADQAEAALVRVCEEASGCIERAWGRAADSFAPSPWKRTPGFGWNYWEAWTLKKDADGSDLLWLDWNATNDVTHPEAEGRSLFFMSGLTADSYENLAATDEDRERHERLEAGVRIDGTIVRFHRVSDDCERLTQIAFPEEVLIGRTLEAQATSLGQWVVRGYKSLTAPLRELDSPAGPTRSGET